MQVNAPKIDQRSYKEILEKVRAIAPFYTPELNLLTENEAGDALLTLFARMLELIIYRMNKAADKNFVAFLDMLGIQPLPARSARVPLTFLITDGAVRNAFVPEGTQAAAPATDKHEELIYITENNLSVTYAKLLNVLSTNPANDAIYDHTLPFLAQRSFNVFAGDNLQEHILYIAHKDLFNIKSATKIELDILLGKAAKAEIIEQADLNWEYWDGEKWLGMSPDKSIVNPKVITFEESGILTVNKKCEGEIKEREINGVKNRWLRCRLTSPISPDLKDDLPLIDTIMAKIPSDPDKVLMPDLAFSHDIPINLNLAELLERTRAEMRGIKTKSDLKFLRDPYPHENDFPIPNAKSARINGISELEVGDLLIFENPSYQADHDLPPYDKVYIDSKKQLGLSAPITAGHLGNAPKGESGKIVRDLFFDEKGVAEGAWKFTDLQPLTAELVVELLKGNIYANIVTENYTNGEIRGQVEQSASTVALKSELKCDLVMADYGKGTGDFTLEEASRKLEYNIDISNVELGSEITEAFFGNATTGKNGPDVQDITFENGIAKGTWQIPQKPINGRNLIEELKDGRIYVSIATSLNPEGETRGQILVEAKKDTGHVLIDNTNGVKFIATLSRDQVVTSLKGTGSGEFSFDVINMKLAYEIYVSQEKLSGSIKKASFIKITNDPHNSIELHVFTEKFNSEGVAIGEWSDLTTEYMMDLLAENIYVNIVTEKFHKGEIRGQVSLNEPITFIADITGDKVIPTPPLEVSKGKGRGEFILNAANKELTFKIQVEDYDPVAGHIFRIFWTGDINSGYNEYSTIRLLTAIRKKTNDSQIDPIEVQVQVEPGTASRFESVLPKEYKDIYLLHKEPIQSPAKELKTALLSKVDTNANTLTLVRTKNEGGFPNPYFEKDIVEYREIAGYIYPFGEDPRLFSTFYISSQEVFSKKGAKVTITFEIGQEVDPDPAKTALVSWEYWNGEGWRILKLEDGSTAENFDVGDEQFIIFYCPMDIEIATVAGHKNYWIRARLVSGHYGKQLYYVGSTLTSGRVAAPYIKFNNLMYELDFVNLECCLCCNNLSIQDHSTAAKFQGQFFRPFECLYHSLETLHLGFDNRLISGPLKLLFSVVEQAIPEESRPKFQWTYWNGQAWTRLNAIDSTEGLTRSEILQFIGAKDLAERELFGKKRYWIRGSLIEGKFESDLQVKGVFPNTTWATQATPIEGEILGSSKGVTNQEFIFLHPPILWQQIFVAEPNLPNEDERKVIENEEGKDAIQESKNEAGQIQQIRIRWHEVDDFYDSTPNSRHYVIDRIQGKVIFGDGKRGMIPPKGINNIIGDYHFGGGKAGNVADNEIISLKSAVPFVKKVSNPIAADGGSDSEATEQTLSRGPQVIKHRNRAVTPEDFEWLSKEASQVVALAKCLSNINNLWQNETGWITIIIVPDSKESKPFPSPTLRNTVYRYLQQRSANTVVTFKHLHITGPRYVEISVGVDVVPKSIDVVAKAEENILQRLNSFFHPLSGGPESKGWEFGRPVRISDVYALIESIEEVDYVKNLVLSANGTIKGDQILIGADELVCSGDHNIRISIEGII